MSAGSSSLPHVTWHDYNPSMVTTDAVDAAGLHGLDREFLNRGDY